MKVRTKWNEFQNKTVGPRERRATTFNFSSIFGILGGVGGEEGVGGFKFTLQIF